MRIYTRVVFSTNALCPLPRRAFTTVWRLFDYYSVEGGVLLAYRWRHPTMCSKPPQLRIMKPQMSTVGSWRSFALEEAIAFVTLGKALVTASWSSPLSQTATLRDLRTGD